MSAGRVRMGLLVLLAAVAVGSTGCDSDPMVTDPVEPWAPTAPVTVRDPWVRAADSGMTAVFGTLVNTSGRDVTVTSASTSVSRTELHETARQHGRTVMRPKKGGIAVEADGTRVLEPGGDHLMLMDVTEPVPAGDEVTVTLTLADGRTTSFTAVARPFSGAGEPYAPGGTSMTPSP